MKGFLLKAKYCTHTVDSINWTLSHFLFSARLFLFDLVACFSRQIWQQYVMHL